MDETLTEFLLARIAEDEAVARRAQRAYQHVLGIPHYFTANSDTSVAMNPRVALTECEAKRRRLAIAVGLEEDADDETYGWAHSVAEQIRKVEALPFTDHPAYLEEWRP